MPLLCSWTTSDSSRLEPQWNCRHWCLKWMKTTLAKVREIVMMPLSCLVQTNQSTRSGSMPRDFLPQQGIYCTDDVFWNSYKSFSIWDACFLGGLPFTATCCAQIGPQNTIHVCALYVEYAVEKLNQLIGTWQLALSMSAQWANVPAFLWRNPMLISCATPSQARISRVELKSKNCYLYGSSFYRVSW